VAGVRVAGFGAAGVTAQDRGRARRRGGIARAAAAADHGFDSPQPGLGTKLLAVVAAVGPQLGRHDPTREQRVEQRQQMGPLVLVAGPDPDREGDVVRVDDQMETAARAASQRATDRVAPFFASTTDASTIARDQSTSPSASNNSCTRANSRSQTPARRHS
jgi:hypothetical protein